MLKRAQDSGKLTESVTVLYFWWHPPIVQVCDEKSKIIVIVPIWDVKGACGVLKGVVINNHNLTRWWTRYYYVLYQLHWKIIMKEGGMIIALADYIASLKSNVCYGVYAGMCMSMCMCVCLSL